MSVSVSIEDEGLCKLAIEGEMTIYNALITKQALDNVVEQHQRYELDLSAVEEIDSAGMQLILCFSKTLNAADKTFAITAASGAVNTLLNRYHRMNLIPGECRG